MTVIAPFFDAKSPGTWKQAKGLDLIGNGTFTVGTTFDYITGVYTDAMTGAAVTNATTEGGSIGLTGQGTHLSIQATSSDASQSVISSILFHYERANETA